MPATPFPSTVAAKYDATTPRLPNCSRPIKESIKQDSLVVSFDSGHEQRRTKSDPKRIFEVTYAALTQNEYATIRDFFLQVTNVTPFTWTHPVEKTVYLVRFDMDTFTGEHFQHSPVAGPLYKLQLKLLQVWS